MKNSLYLNIVDKVIDSSNRNSQFDYFDYSKPSDWEWLIKEYIYNTKESRKPHYDNDQAGKQIIREGDSWNEKNVFQKNVDLKFSFPDWKYDELNQCQRSSVRHSKLSIFTEEQQEQAKRSLEAWSDVANINFTEAPPDEQANITFGNYIAPAYGGYASYPKIYCEDYRGHRVGGQVWLNNDIQWYKGLITNIHPECGNWGRYSILHEVGHALGLNHPGDYDGKEGNPSYRSSASYTQDTHQYSVMSYWSEYWTGAEYKGYHPAAPQLDDISAIQHLYGANMQTRTGDTVYGFNSNTERDFYTIKNANEKKIFTVWDAGGNDTLDFSGYSQNQNINLNELSFSDVGGLKKNVAIAKGVIIENAIGGSGNDVIVGNAANNYIDGGAGDDIIYGGAGQDTLKGGAGANVFVFKDISDSPYMFPDHIIDFKTGIDLIYLAPLNKENNIHFTGEFTGKAGEFAVLYDPQTNISEVIGTFNNNGTMDMRINITGQVNFAIDFSI